MLIFVLISLKHAKKHVIASVQRVEIQIEQNEIYPYIACDELLQYLHVFTIRITP